MRNRYCSHHYIYFRPLLLEPSPLQALPLSGYALKELYRHQSLNVVFAGHFCSGWRSHFVGFESGQKQCAEYGLQHNSTPLHPPPPQPHTVCIYWTFSLGRGGGGGGGQREGRGATLHKYSSFVHGGNSWIVHKLGQKYQHEWMFLH